MITIGGAGALMTPISGMVTWKSESDFEQKRLERLVGAVDLVDQQHRRAAVASARAPAAAGGWIEIALGEDVVLDAVLVVLARGFGEPDRHHLRGIVPFVDRGRDVEALVALQADQPAAERRGEHLGDFGLADARLAFEQNSGRPRRKLEEQDGRERALGDIGRAAEQRERLVDRGGPATARH